MNLALLAVAAIALGQAIQARDGLYDRLGLAALAVATVACASAFVPRFRDRLRGSVHGVLAGGLLLQFMQLFLQRPGSENAFGRGVGPSLFLHACLGAAMIATALIAFEARRWRAAFGIAV